ncbi:MAG: class I SAM-dependent methyltransferase [Gammaproteobacteria bacterium]|nr:class I SAM-dependent methyltransferase [Gammaproteobacteria bacterium]
MDKFSDKAIIESWRKNANAWVDTIKNEKIISRTEVTNHAILSAVLSHKPSHLLDIGCGEGWLIRELSKSNVACTGMDVIPEFSEHVESSGGRFKQLAYEAFKLGVFDKKFDVIVCNFSLLGKESVENVIEQSVGVLNTTGTLIVQTVHPIESSCSDDYTDGWRKGSWEGFDEAFTDPAPWYFRTLESWKILFNQAGFDQLNVTEPCHPQTGKKMSVLFEAKSTYSKRPSSKAIKGC